MTGVRVALRMSLGGAVCGCFLGIFAGGLVGGLWGGFLGDVSVGLDGALVGGGVGFLAGAVYGAYLAVREGRTRTDRTAAPTEQPVTGNDEGRWPRPTEVQGRPDPPLSKIATSRGES